MRRSFGYYLTHWYTFREVVGPVIGVAIALLMFGSLLGGYVLHPEDRLAPSNNSPAPDVVIVGIDDNSLNASGGNLGHFPFTREVYANFLNEMVKDKAAVVAFDVAFSEHYTDSGDAAFQTSIANASGAKVPVLLAYGQSALKPATGNGRLTMDGPDQLPIRILRCADPPVLDAAGKHPNEYAPCSKPIAELAGTTVLADADGVVRSFPMFVEPECHVNGHCPELPVINPLNFIAYRDFFAGAGGGAQGPVLTQSGAQASFGPVWQKPLYVDPNGQALIGFSGQPGNVQAHGQYFSIGDVVPNGDGKTPSKIGADKFAGKIVLVGAYNLAGNHDEQLVPTLNGAQYMYGIEIHANMATMFLQPASYFLTPEPVSMILLTLLAFGLVMGFFLARLTVIWGLLAAAAALIAYTFAMAFVHVQFNVVPNLFNVWVGIVLTYTGLTAYRFLYEDREKRKVTSIFGQYLKPEIVNQLAKARSANEILTGGERRELTMLFVDIRGFTAMSEGMQADDVLKVTSEYLTDLTRIIFKWDGTVDKYVGDEIVAIWNAPHEQAGHSLLAVRCAYDMLTHGPELQERLGGQGLPRIKYGVGINTGPAVVGNMGSRMRLQYTALGDTVNTAARFCGAAGPFELLIGETTYEQCKDYLAVELAPGIQLKGKSAEKFKIYKVQAIREEPGKPWVPFPTATYTQTQTAYAEQTMLGAGSTVAVESSQPQPEAEPLPAGPPGSEA